MKHSEEEIKSQEIEEITSEEEKMIEYSQQYDEDTIMEELEW